MLARLATRKAKPAGSYHLYLRDLAEFIEPLEIDDLHGFGYSTRDKAQEKLGTTSLGRLAKMSKGVLCEALGKGMGETLYNALRGIDNRKLESDKPRKSVSCDINVSLNVFLICPIAQRRFEVWDTFREQRTSKDLRLSAG